MEHYNMLGIVTAGWLVFGAIFFKIYGCLDRKFSIVHTILFFVLYPLVVTVVTRKLLSEELYGEDSYSDDSWDCKFINKVFGDAWR